MISTFKVVVLKPVLNHAGDELRPVVRANVLRSTMLTDGILQHGQHID